MALVFNPIDPDFLADPYPTYARLRAEAPVDRHPAGFFVVSRYAEVERLLRDAETFSSAAMGGQVPARRADGQLAMGTGSLISQDPPVHTAQRGIVNRGFTPRRIEALAPRVVDAIDELFVDFIDTGRVDLTNQFAGPLPVTVIAELLGLDADRRDDFKRWSASLIVASTSPGGLADRTSQMDVALEFERYMTEVIAERRSVPGDDLISLLVTAEEQTDVLTAEQVVAFASLLLAAGSETTMNLIGSAVVALLEHPEWLQKVRQDPGLVPQVLEETLRWDSPVQLVMRLTTCDTELGGVEIPKGSMVAPLLASANRDEDRFHEAERFDPARESQGHLAFGFGNHFCLGASLARLEARLALETILDRLGDFRLERTPVERHGSFLIRGPKALPLVFE